MSDFDDYNFSDDDVRDFDETRVENLLGEEEEELPVPDLITLATEYIGQGYSEEEALGMAEAMINSINEKNNEIKIERLKKEAEARSNVIEESPLVKKRNEELRKEREKKQLDAEEEEHQKFINEKRNALEPFLQVLARTNKPLQKKLDNFIDDKNAMMLPDPDGTIRDELSKTRPGKTVNGKIAIETYILPGEEPDEESSDYDDYAFAGGKKKRKSKKQRKSKKLRKTKKQRKSRKQRK